MDYPPLRKKRIKKNSNQLTERNRKLQKKKKLKN